MGQWVKSRGNAGEQAAYNIGNMARAMNDTNLLTYSTKIMAATDDTFGFVMARARSREKAMDAVEDALKNGEITEVTPELIKAFDNKFYSEFLDEAGDVKFDSDAALKFAKEEATLTRDLSGFAKGLETIFNKAPWAKPFFLFARTGVNGLELTAKHMPLFNRMVKDERRILNATAEDVLAGKLADVGLSTVEDLRAAKHLSKGRQAIGAGIITMAAFHFMNGGLTGNGPTNRQQRNLWMDAGYKPRSIRIGDAWVSYDSFEPFGTILSSVADIGDWGQGMGPEWQEQKYAQLAQVVAQGITSKSYLAGLQQFVDLFSGEPGQQQKMLAALANNTVPLAGLRNELGRLFNPFMRELNADFLESIRNRNLISEHMTPDQLPVKYDILNGNPINDWDFPTRVFNMFSPVNFNLVQSPGRTLLFNSNYDMRLSVMYSPTGVSLRDSSEVRSLYAQALGKQNLDRALNKLAQRKDIQESVQRMISDRNNNRRAKDPMVSYIHNREINKLFRDAQGLSGIVIFIRVLRTTSCLVEL